MSSNSRSQSSRIRSREVKNHGGSSSSSSRKSRRKRMLKSFDGEGLSKFPEIEYVVYDSDINRRKEMIAMDTVDTTENTSETITDDENDLSGLDNGFGRKKTRQVPVGKGIRQYPILQPSLCVPPLPRPRPTSTVFHETINIEDEYNDDEIIRIQSNQVEEYKLSNFGQCEIKEQEPTALPEKTTSAATQKDRSYDYLLPNIFHHHHHSNTSNSFQPKENWRHSNSKKMSRRRRCKSLKCTPMCYCCSFVLFIIALSTTLAIFFTCFFRGPEVNFDRMTVTKHSNGQQLDLNSHFLVFNPNFFGLELKNVELKVFGSEEPKTPPLHTSVFQSLTLPSQEKTTFTIPISLNIANISNSQNQHMSEFIVNLSKTCLSPPPSEKSLVKLWVWSSFGWSVISWTGHRFTRKDKIEFECFDEIKETLAMFKPS